MIIIAKIVSKKVIELGPAHSRQKIISELSVKYAVKTVIQLQIVLKNKLI